MLVFDKKTDTNARQNWRKIAGLENVNPLKDAESKAPILKDTNAVYLGGGLGQSLVGGTNCDACKTDNKVDTGGGDGGNSGDGGDGGDSGGGGTDTPDAPSVIGQMQCLPDVDADGNIIYDSPDCCGGGGSGDGYTNITANYNLYAKMGDTECVGSRETVNFTMPGNLTGQEVAQMVANVGAKKASKLADCMDSVVSYLLTTVKDGCSGDMTETIVNCTMARFDDYIEQILRADTGSVNSSFYFNLSISRGIVVECQKPPEFSGYCNFGSADLYCRISFSSTRTAEPTNNGKTYYRVGSGENAFLVECKRGE